MAAPTPPASGPSCTRCRQPLPAGTTFCLACGFNNGGEAFAKKQLSVGLELQRRGESQSFWRRLIGLKWLTK